MERPIRIAFFVHRFPVVSEAFIVNAAAGLIDAGHEVDIYALHGAGEADHGRHGLVSDYGLEDRTSVFRLRERPRARLAWAPLAGARLLAAHGLRSSAAMDAGVFGADGPSLVALHEADMFRGQGRYDILHCHFGTLAEPVLNHRRAGFLSGRVFVHFRGYDISSFVQERGEQVYDRVFREADGFFAGCTTFRDRALALGAAPDRMSLVFSPVAIDKFPFRARAWIPGEPLRVLAVGRLVEKKGFRFALDALARLADEGLDLRFDVVGDGPLREALQAQAAGLGLADRTLFHGAATHEQIAAHLNRAHIFLAPSTTASNGDQDASINTLKEAMAAGCPFVTTTHGGIPEMVAGVDAGIMAPEADAPALARAMRTLLDRRADWPQMGLRGQAHIRETYSIEAVTAATVAAYERALSATPSHAFERVAP